jgi:hypothetical protein
MEVVAEQLLIVKKLLHLANNGIQTICSNKANVSEKACKARNIDVCMLSWLLDLLFAMPRFLITLVPQAEAWQTE